MKRRSVKKISPSRTSSFDQQFWPVMIAVTVLSGIALGGILTILRGPWMWGSLLLLPLFAAGSIFLLFQLDDSKLRRSLQFAIVCSLAAHMLVLVFASVLNIFGNPFKPKQREISQQRVRTIEISDQRASFVWEETNDHETPEPRVEQKRRKPTTTSQPQPIPVKEEKREVQPQLVRRETPSESIPRQSRELSKLRRQTQNLQPQSSQKMTGEKVAENNPAQTKPVKKQTVESAKQSESVPRQTVVQRQPEPKPDKKSEPQPTAEAPETAPKPEIARATSSPRRSTTTETAVASLPRPSSSNARVKRTTPKVPKASKALPIAEKVAAATSKTRVDTQPSKAASKVTRREVKRDLVRPSMTKTKNNERSPKPQIARATTRRETTQSQPSISSETSVKKTARRAVTEAPKPVSPVAIENPARAPESRTATNELKSKTLSITRSTEGVAGVGRAQNLDRFVGGMASPARRASDSARRERTQSAAKDSQMLVSSTRAELRRSAGTTKMPTSAFKADSSLTAKIAGTTTPQKKSMESSAATINSASTKHRDTMSAEKGSSNVDLGPTKVVRDRQTNRRSGGGQPEVARLNPDRTRRSRDSSTQQPSLAAATGVEVMAPATQSAQPSSSVSTEVASRNVTIARTGGKETVTLEEWSADVVGKVLDMGQSDSVSDLADARERARHEESELTWDEEEDDEDEENQRGKIRTRIAQTPVTRGEVGFGIAQSDGTSATKADQPSDSTSESIAAKMTKQATASIPGSGLGQTATNILLQAATSLPIIEAAPGTRTGRAPTKAAETSAGVAGSREPRRRTSRSTNPSAPASIATPVNPTSVAAAPGSTESVISFEPESSAVSIAKSDLSSMEQIQGAKLDVMALEGPAGLGDRPDTYIGVMSRPASRDSEQIQPNLKNRFKKSVYGGMPAINPDVVVAEEAFRNRSPSSLSKVTEPTTEAAIHLGLEFLARNQSGDGSWSLTKYDRDEAQHLTQLDSDTAGTGLALLAFQGAGYNHREFKYARQIDHALQWLIENQSEDGGLYVPSNKKSNSACRLYSHGIAALALTEAYGMTQDIRLKEPAQKAIDYIIATQDLRKGGWRYFDEPGKRSSDTSVSGWMMMALQSGRLAGLDVKQQTFDGIDDWLDVAASPDNQSQYRYNPYAIDSKGVSRIQGRKPSASMTSVGLLMRIYSGWKRDDARLQSGADYLLNQQMPSDATPAQRDTYYWYYSTQVLKHVGGERWEKWNEQLRPLLTRSQEKTGDLAGSWHPYKPVPDRWGSFGGRLYVTTMNLLSLEVRHRMLPIYQQSDDKILGLIESGKESPVSTTIVPSEALASEIVAPEPEPILAPEPKPMVTRVEPEIESRVEPKLEPKKEPKKVVTISPATKRAVPKSPVANKPQPKRTRPKSASTKTPSAKPLPVVEPKIVAKKPQPKELNPKPEPKASVVAKKPTATRKTPKVEPPAITPKSVAPKVVSAQQSRRKPPEMPAPKGTIRLPAKTPARPSAKINPSKSTKPSVVDSVPRPDKTADLKPDAIKPKPPVKTKAVSKAPVNGTITGTLTLDGKKLKGAKIQLIPLDPKANPISIKSNQIGRYNFASSAVSKTNGVKPGTYRVSITTYSESPDVNVIDFLETVPAKYNSKTTLKIKVVPGKNAFNFKLTSE